MLNRVLCFLVASLTCIEFDIAGGLFASELFLPCIASVLLLTQKISRFDQHFRIVLQIGLAYLAAQIASDLWNGTSYDQYSRGWARICVFIVNFVSIYILINNRRSHLLLFALGFSVGRIWLAYSGMEGDAIPWKIGLSKPVTLVILILCATLPFLRRSRTFLVPVILLGLGMINIIMDFRSLGAVLMMVSMLILSSNLRGNRVKQARQQHWGTIFGPVFASLIAAFGAYQFYAYAAQSGWLSERAASKFEIQTSNPNLPVLITGRNEVLIFLEAIWGSPLIGHGSWPKDPYYADKYAAERYRWGISNNNNRPETDEIPIHSHLFGSWIEAGFVGGVFWIFNLYLIVLSLMRAHQGQSHMRPLYIYAAVLLIWDIFFSPFSGFRRLETAFLIVVVLRSLLQRIPSSQLLRYKGPTNRRRRRKRREGGQDKGKPVAARTAG